ncbi:MAG: ComEC/Rec2 family competence protein, partial [Actinomycetes bacterium]
MGPLVVPSTALIVALALGCVVLFARRRLAPEVVVALLLVAVGLASMALRVAQRDAGLLPIWADEGRNVGITGVVVTDPEFTERQTFGGAGDTQVRVTVRAEYVVSGREAIDARVAVLAVGDGAGWQDARWGDTVSFTGSLRPGDRTRPVAAVVFVATAPQIERLAPAPLQKAEAMRGGLRDAVNGTAKDAQSLLPALVVGDTSAMTPLLTADLRDSGLAHLTAVSGANVAIVVGAVLLAARWAGARSYWLVALGLVAVVWFVLLARPQPSVLRAAVMGSVALVAVGVAGRPQAVRTLLASVTVLLLVDPWLSRSWGFALSVAATGGLVVLARRWSERLPSRWPVGVRQAVAVACAAQVATLPLVVALSGQVAVLSVVANLLAAPAVAPATVFGAAAAAVSPIWPQLAHLLAWCGQWPAWWIAAVAQRAASAPLATLPWPSGWAGAFLSASCLGAVVGLWWWGSRRAWWRRRRVVALGVLGVLLLAAVLVGPGRWPPSGWVMVACDVGQGDALVVNVGDHAGLVVDAGPDPALVDRCLDQLGITQVPLLVLTHFHADHVGGLAGVLDDRSVESVLVSPLRDPPEQVDQVARQLDGITVADATVGQTGRWGDASWQVLWPADLVDGEGSAANNA